MWLLACKITTPADASLADSRGRSLLWWACHKGLVLATMLIDKGADVNAADTLFKRTPLLACTGFNKWQSMIKALLAKGADVHAVSADGTTALAVLVRNASDARSDSAEYLLLLAEGNAFKGAAQAPKLLQSIGLAVIQRAASAASAASAAAAK